MYLSIIFYNIINLACGDNEIEVPLAGCCYLLLNIVQLSACTNEKVGQKFAVEHLTCDVLTVRPGNVSP